MVKAQRPSLRGVGLKRARSAQHANSVMIWSVLQRKLKRLFGFGTIETQKPRPDNDEFKLRSLFAAGKGKKLIVGDYEQLEMRIFAHFSQDSGMLGAIRKGMDLHCFTVSLMNDVPYEEAVDAVKQKDKDKSKLTDRQKWLIKQRQAAKAIGFGLIYGAGPPKIAAQLDITKEEAEEKIKAYFDSFPGALVFIEETHRDCYNKGYVETLVGRRRRLKDIRQKNYQLRGAAERESVNSIIQGTAADMAKTAMLCIDADRDLNMLGAILLNQIHDELVIEVPEENADEALPIIKHYMEFPFDGKQALCVATPADLKIVDNWAQAK